MTRERLVELLEKAIVWTGEDDGGYSCDIDETADLILSELAKDKPTAHAGLVEELREVIANCYRPGIDGEPDGCPGGMKMGEILSRYEARKEVVLGEGHLVKFIDQTGRPSYFCARRHEGKRGKLIFVEEDSK